MKRNEFKREVDHVPPLDLLRPPLPRSGAMGVANPVDVGAVVMGGETADVGVATTAEGPLGSDRCVSSGGDGDLVKSASGLVVRSLCSSRATVLAYLHAQRARKKSHKVTNKMCCEQFTLIRQDTQNVVGSMLSCCPLCTSQRQPVEMGAVLKRANQKRSKHSSQVNPITFQDL